MFCQNCGNAIVEGLNFCNRCGARTSSELEKKELPTKPVAPLIAIIIVMTVLTAGMFLGGLGILLPLVFGLIGAGVETGAIVAIAFLLLGTICGVSYLMVRQISNALNAYLHGSFGTTKQISNQQQQPSATQFINRNTGQIEAPREPFTSVTEHTTRILDPVQQEKKL
jgi:Na+(H+)/acetate symporter ActP